MYDLTQEILNHREDPRVVTGSKFVAAGFEKERSTVDCKNPEDSISLLNSRLASELDQGPRNGLSTFAQKTAYRFERNDNAFQSPTALGYGGLEKLPSFRSQFQFAQPFRSDASSIPPHSTSFSTLAGIAASQHNFASVGCLSIRGRPSLDHDPPAV